MIPAEVGEVEALSPEDAATSWCLAQLAKHACHDNAPDPDTVGVVDLETAEAMFVCIRVAVEVTAA